MLLQRDTDASQRSAKLAVQTAVSKKAREEASEMLAAARRLKQEAEEIREAGLQERRRASAEVLILLRKWCRFWWGKGVEEDTCFRHYVFLRSCNL